VSDTGGPLNEEYIINFREGYIAAKERYTEDESSPPIQSGEPLIEALTKARKQ